MIKVNSNVKLDFGKIQMLTDALPGVRRGMG